MRRIIIGTSLLMALGIINLLENKPVEANPDLVNCLENNRLQSASTVSQVNTSQHDYYWIENYEGESVDSVIFKIDSQGNCDRLVNSEQIAEYPLSNFLEPQLAQGLIESRYATIIQELGGKEAFVNGLVAELDADTPHVFFEDEVAVLKKLGIDLEQIDSSLFVVGEEGINAHPELRK